MHTRPIERSARQPLAVALAFLQSKKRATSARLSQQVRSRAGYAACLCIAPVVEPLPRIALIERSIADHNRLISDAARPSE